MPLYNYSCSKCTFEFETLLSISRMEEPLSQPCPDCETEGTITQLVTAASIGDPIKLGIKRPDAGWNDVLGKIKKAHPRGNWNNKRIQPRAGR